MTKKAHTATLPWIRIHGEGLESSKYCSGVSSKLNHLWIWKTIITSQTHFCCNLATVRCDNQSVQIECQSLRYSCELRSCVAESDDRYNHVTQILAGNKRKPRQNKSVPFQNLGFGNFLKRHRSKHSAAIVAAGKGGIPSQVETNHDDAIVSPWMNHPKRVLYLTLQYAYDGYGNEAKGATDIVTA